jgi:hypothetical protein
MRNSPPSDLGAVFHIPWYLDLCAGNLQGVTEYKDNVYHQADYIAHENAFFRPESNRMAVKFIDEPCGEFHKEADGKRAVHIPTAKERIPYTGEEFWFGFKDIESLIAPVDDPSGECGWKGPPYHGDTKVGIVVHWRDFTPEWVYEHLCVDRPSVIYAEGIFLHEAEAVAWVTNAY